MGMADSPESDPEYQANIMKDDKIENHELEEQSHHDEEDQHYESTDDQFEDEDEFDVVDIRNHRPRFANTKRFRMVIIVPIVVGVLAFFAVYFSTRGRGGSSSSEGSITLQDPPTDLDTTCSTSAVTDAPTECMKACERADCCDFPANLPLSCLEGNQQKCLVYHAACSHLDADSFDESTIPSSVPPAPANLNELCASSSLQTVDGFTGCHEACKLAECCYEDNVGTCTHEECTGYAPCLTLAATDHVHEDIPSVVGDLCDDENLSTKHGRAECRQACSHALCCFTDSCKHQDASFCSQYEKCNQLKSTQAVDATSEEIELACKDDEDVPGHVSLCELVCQKGACCFSDDEACEEVAPDVTCSDFEPCRAVFVTDTDSNKEKETDVDDTITDNDETTTTDTNIVDGDDWRLHMNKEAIENACETAELVQLPGQESLCHQVCAAGKCCFGRNTCNVDDPELFCTNFAPCAKVHSNSNPTGNPDVDVQAIEEACGAGVEDDLDQATLCDKLCEPGDCCFTPEGCSVPDPEQFCANFGACDDIGVLDDDDELDQELDNEDQDEDSNGNPYVDVQAIEAACGSGNVDGVDQAQLCDKLCQPGDCCNDLEGCSVPDQDSYCAKFVACNDLDDDVDDKDLEDFNDGDENPFVDVDALEAACAPGAEENVEQADWCDELCQPGDCCDAPEGCSVPDQESYCANFEVCNDLDDDDDEDDEMNEDDMDIENENQDQLSDKAKEIQAACGENHAEVVNFPDRPTLCQTLCEEAECCFKEGGCSEADPRFCAQYLPCKKLHIYNQSYNTGKP